MTPETFSVGVGAHGFDPQRLKEYRAAVVDPNTGLLRFGALWTVEEGPAEVAESPAIVEHCLAHWRAALPIHRWLVDKLQR